MPLAFLGGLPRSGSTMLSALLRQNPNFDVTPTGWALPLVQGMQNQWTAAETRKAWLDQGNARERLHRAIRGALEGYGMGKVSVEKTRGVWPYMELLSDVLGGPPKVVAPIRDLRGCLTSMERLWRRHPEYAGFGPGSTIGDRVTNWMDGNYPPLGSVLPQIQDAIHRGVADYALFVRMEDLAANPEAELRRIYQYLGEPWPSSVHRFDHVTDQNREHDAIHGPFGDHEIHDGPIHSPSEDWDDWLGPEIPAQVVANNRWFYERFYPERL